MSTTAPLLTFGRLIADFTDDTVGAEADEGAVKVGIGKRVQGQTEMLRADEID